MLDFTHQRFLGKYFMPGTHYSKEEAPIAVGTSHHTSSSDLDYLMHTKSIDNIIQYYAVDNPNIKQHHITNALNSGDSDLAWSATTNINISPENLKIALSHRFSDVRDAAINHPRYVEYFPNGHQ
jgi:hypothetical protein